MFKSWTWQNIWKPVGKIKWLHIWGFFDGQALRWENFLENLNLNIYHKYFVLLFLKQYLSSIRHKKTAWKETFWCQHLNQLMVYGLNGWVGFMLKGVSVGSGWVNGVVGGFWGLYLTSLSPHPRSASPTWCHFDSEVVFETKTDLKCSNCVYLIFVLKRMLRVCVCVSFSVSLYICVYVSIFSCIRLYAFVSVFVCMCVYMHWTCIYYRLHKTRLCLHVNASWTLTGLKLSFIFQKCFYQRELQKKMYNVYPNIPNNRNWQLPKCKHSGTAQKGVIFSSSFSSYFSLISPGLNVPQSPWSTPQPIVGFMGPRKYFV